MPELVEITAQNESEIRHFLSLAGDSLKTFRYFNSRGFEVINNHLITYLLKVRDRAVGYGHLDKEADIVWLGIVVAEHEKGKGYGSFLMRGLIDKAEQLGIHKIQLSVDDENALAILLYKKFGFHQFKQLGTTLYFERLL